MHKYWLIVVMVLLSGISKYGYAKDMGSELKDNSADSGFSITEKTNDSTIARFRGDGKVGIGTADPNATLDVWGNIGINGISIINSSGQWVGDTTGLVGSEGPQGPPGPQGPHRVFRVKQEHKARKGNNVPRVWQGR